MTEKILLSCSVFTVSYCTALGQKIRWSAIGSTDKMECRYPQYIKSNQTGCLWRFHKCTNGSCWYGRLQEDNRVKINDNQRLGIFDLQISNVSFDDQGDYWCECSYKVYFYSIAYRLKLKDIPDPPTNVSSNTCTRITISWTPGARGNLPQEFFIEYKKVKSKLWQRIGPINQTSITEMTYKISVVSFDTLYEIRIFAENEIGRSIYSSVVRTTAFVIKSKTEDSVASKPFMSIQHWLVLGAITVIFVLTCILSHVCKYCKIKKNPGSAATTRLLGHKEIGSVQYNFIGDAPVVPAPGQENVQINFNNELEIENYLRGSFDNAEPVEEFPGIGNDQTIFRRRNGQGVNFRNLPKDNLEPAFDNHPLKEQTVNAESYENPYTPLRQDTHEEYRYSQCRNSGVFQEQNTQNIVDYNDYINLML